MTENLADINTLIQSSVETAVQQYVTAVLGENDWQHQFEKRILDHVQQRITAKFANLSTMTELQPGIEVALKTLFEQGTIPGVDRYIDPDRVTARLTAAAESAIDHIAESVQLDPDWLERIEKSLQQSMTRRLLNLIGNIDLDQLLVRTIDDGIQRWQHRLLQDFRTKGIVDRAQSCELAVVDGAVVITTALAAPRAEIQQDLVVKGTTHVRDLEVTGLVNVDCESWQELSRHVAGQVQVQLDQEWRDTLVQQVLDHSRTQGISFGEVMIGDDLLISGNRLSAAITETNIRSLGNLSHLAVSGPAELANTVFVSNNRMGINSSKPDAALTIWDEEVALSLGKHSKDHAFVGTSRLQKLVLGVNKQKHLVIDEQGLVSVHGLRIDRWKISHHDTVPGWSGTKGDIVFNSSPSESAPMGWSCLGGYRWRELWTR